MRLSWVFLEKCWAFFFFFLMWLRHIIDLRFKGQIGHTLFHYFSQEAVTYKERSSFSFNSHKDLLINTEVSDVLETHWIFRFSLCLENCYKNIWHERLLMGERHCLNESFESQMRVSSYLLPLGKYYSKYIFKMNNMHSIKQWPKLLHMILVEEMCVISLVHTPKDTYLIFLIFSKAY